MAELGCSGLESVRRQWSDVSWGHRKAQVGLEVLLRWFTHVAGKLVGSLRFSCGPLHATAWVSSGHSSWLPPEGAVQKREGARRKL